MNASDLPAFDDQCFMPVSHARRSTPSGRVASSRTTTSGFTVRMTEASGTSRPAPPRRMLYERMRTLLPSHLTRLTRLTRPLDQRQERLIEQPSPKLDHHIARGLDVDGPSRHDHQRFTKRDQGWRNVR